MARFPVIAVLVALVSPTPAFAQSAAPAEPLTLGGVTVSGSLRTRVEGWNWFEADANDDYAFSGSLLRASLRRASRRYAWQLELAVPLLVALPDDAIAAVPQGQLGLGANYFAANDGSRHQAAVFLKQALVRLNDVAGVPGQSLSAGRMEFVDGTEVTPKHPTVAAVKRDRVAHRLIGNFAFSHVGRSIDGVQYVRDTPAWNVTALAGRPTQGVFQVDGWGEVDVNLAYAALTHQHAAPGRASEWRLFTIAYGDRRNGVLKTDNRPAAVRRGDTDRITLATVGGHYIGAIETARGPIDLLAWGAAQAGAWGTLDHRAAAIAAEAGWQIPNATLRPWVRGGYDYASGDSDPNDARHGTFFQVLPTPRVYARFPFFNLMNIGDAFAEVLLRPSTSLTGRVDVHALRLADANDLWYSGGGAFQPSTFGYTGRPSNGARNLATLLDASAEYAVNPHAAVGIYGGLVRAGTVVESTYPKSSNAQFGYVELTVRF
jgi:alginate export protein